MSGERSEGIGPEHGLQVTALSPSPESLSSDRKGDEAEWGDLYTRTAYHRTATKTDRLTTTYDNSPTLKKMDNK